MKSKSADKIKMPSIDELLGVSGEESATDIEISRIHSFVNLPFKVLVVGYDDAYDYWEERD